MTFASKYGYGLAFTVCMVGAFVILGLWLVAWAGLKQVVPGLGGLWWWAGAAVIVWLWGWWLGVASLPFSNVRRSDVR